MSRRWLPGLLCLCLHGAASADGLPAADEIVAKVEAADRGRRASMPGYSAVRHYAVENTRFKVKASMTVKVEVDHLGMKRFQVQEVSGPAAVRKLVFQRMLDTEAKASSRDAQASSRISRENYSFRLLEQTTAQGRPQYVLEAEPKSVNPLLFRGRMWVDAESSAVVRIEGAPAQNPSFWVKKTHFIHEYVETNDQWMASSNRSESDIRIFGKSVVTIRYGDYVFRPAAQGSNTAGDPDPARIEKSR